MVSWKTIKYRGVKVKVSDTGRVFHKGKVSKKYDLNGYWYVSLPHNFTGRNMVAIHHLVCKAFKSNYTYSCIPNHLDANKKNNNASNLKCGTHSDNVRHAHKMGLVQKGKEMWKGINKNCYANYRD